MNENLLAGALGYLGETEPVWDYRIGELDVVVITHDGRKRRVSKAKAEMCGGVVEAVGARVVSLLRENGILDRLDRVAEAELKAISGIGPTTAKKIMAAIRGE